MAALRIKVIEVMEFTSGHNNQEKPAAAIALADGSSKNQSCWGCEVYSHFDVYANVVPAVSCKL